MIKFDKEYCIPPISEWTTIIQTNKARLSKFNHLRDKVRKVLTEEAFKFTKSLGIELTDPEITDTVVMTGHQPEIYHHGILYKNHVLQSFSKTQRTVGINLIIDTDEGAAGTLVFPAYIDKVPGKKKIAFSKDFKPYFSQKLPNEMPSSEFLSLYSGLEGSPIVEAHTLARRRYEKSGNYLEIPLSSVLNFPEVKQFISEILKDAKKFAAIYNETLDSYRQEEKIKNKANPFPNLKVSDSGTELPFWLINSKDNSRISYTLGASIDQGFLAPKAAIITLIARLLLCDLFIHGTGGAKYDKFTDRFIKNYYQIEPPGIVVATADRFYFKQEIESYEKDKEVAEKRRRILFHPDKYLNDLNLKEDIKAKIVKLSQEKNLNVEKIKAGKAARISTAEYTQDIKRIESEIKEIVNSVLGINEKFVEPSKIYLDTIYSRDFSYLVFNE